MNVITNLTSTITKLRGEIANIDEELLKTKKQLAQEKAKCSRLEVNVERTIIESVTMKELMEEEASNLRRKFILTKTDLEMEMRRAF